MLLLFHIGTAIRELSQCFFTWNLLDQKREVAKLKKDKPDQFPAGMTINAIFEKQPLSFWQGKVRRQYLRPDQAVANLTSFYRAWVDGPKGLCPITHSKLINDGFVESFDEILKLAAAGCLSGTPLMHLMFVHHKYCGMMRIVRTNVVIVRMCCCATTVQLMLSWSATAVQPPCN
jgi:hypothetical protein